MKILKKEIIWPVALLIISYLIYNPDLSFNSNNKSTIDINIHDTYFVIESLNILFLIIAVLFFIVYLVRTIASRLKNNIINGMFLFSNILMIIVVAYIIKITRLLIVEAGWTIYPPPSANIQIHEDNSMKNIFRIAIGIQIFLVITLILVAVKTAINIKKTKASKI
ncbi:hypothetical protein [Flavobacterium ajazii]|uniref:hypothetical protein n=1 Tax=Flavobacterium ajazii TaxID=2692318 RepID=UPI0013D6C2DB|nr:hypothetical protein [Flavobacterium ajazii]